MNSVNSAKERCINWGPFKDGCYITLNSIVLKLAHWPSTEEIFGLNPLDCNFLSANSINISITYCGQT